MISLSRPTAMLILFIWQLLGPPQLLAQQFKLPSLETFISDTLDIQIKLDSSVHLSSSQMQVVDSRSMNGSILGIRQTKKFRYIPVDQYLVMDQSLSDLFKAQFLRDSLELMGTLHLSHLILWTDNSSVLNKGLCLNAYTTYHDSVGNPISDWMWEIRFKEKKRKQEEADYLESVVQELISAQSKALIADDFNPEFYPHLYRRQLMT